MKACNFASLDPALDRQGLGNVSKADRELWEQFQQDSGAIVTQAESVFSSLDQTETSEIRSLDFTVPSGNSETVREVRVRCVQRFFRQAVMVGYGYRCALSGLNTPDLLIASHIIPWKDDEKRRADPTNGIALNALYDRAFDQGYIAFDADYRVLISSRLHEEMKGNKAVDELFNIEGKQLMLPDRFLPDSVAITYHRDNIYKN